MLFPVPSKATVLKCFLLCNMHITIFLLDQVSIYSFKGVVSKWPYRVKLNTEELHVSALDPQSPQCHHHLTTLSTQHRSYRVKGTREFYSLVLLTTGNIKGVKLFCTSEPTSPRKNLDSVLTGPGVSPLLLFLVSWTTFALQAPWVFP